MLRNMGEGHLQQEKGTILELIEVGVDHLIDKNVRKKKMDTNLVIGMKRDIAWMKTISNIQVQAINEAALHLILNTNPNSRAALLKKIVEKTGEKESHRREKINTRIVKKSIKSHLSSLQGEIEKDLVAEKS